MANFKSYYIEIRAVRITHQNLPELKELDTGDGVLEEDFDYGDWFAEGINGYQLMPSNIDLIPVKGGQEQ